MEKSFGVDGDIIYQKKPKANINLHYGSSTVCIFNSSLMSNHIYSALSLEYLYSNF